MSQSRQRGWISRLFFPGSGSTTPSGSAVEGRPSPTTQSRPARLAGHGASPEDDERAAERWRLAAEEGSAPAQTSLGLMFESGRGVVRSAAEASRWFRRAAEQGDAGAQFNLGNLCHPASL